jgi:hypothetical protein
LRQRGQSVGAVTIIVANQNLHGAARDYTAKLVGAWSCQHDRGRYITDWSARRYRSYQNASIGAGAAAVAGPQQASRHGPVHPILRNRGFVWQTSTSAAASHRNCALS